MNVEDFVRHLYETVEQCDYGEKRGEFPRDRLVIGPADRELSERLQMKPDVELEEAIHLARQSELVKTQMNSQSQGQNLRGGESWSYS